MLRPKPEGLVSQGSLCPRKLDWLTAFTECASVEGVWGAFGEVAFSFRE
jgi:hypothetical protein